MSTHLHSEPVSYPVEVSTDDPEANLGAMLNRIAAEHRRREQQQRRRTELASAMVPPALRYFPLYPGCPLAARYGPSFVIPKRGMPHG